MKTHDHPTTPIPKCGSHNPPNPQVLIFMPQESYSEALPAQPWWYSSDLRSLQDRSAVFSCVVLDMHQVKKFRDVTVTEKNGFSFYLSLKFIGTCWHSRFFSLPSRICQSKQFAKYPTSRKFKQWINCSKGTLCGNRTQLKKEKHFIPHLHKMS